MSAEDIKKDPVITSILNEGGLEQPSSNFTDQIINTIKAQSSEAVYQYKPVISRSAWLVFTFVGVALFGYILFGLPAETKYPAIQDFFASIDTSGLKNFMGSLTISIKLSPILKTSLIALTFFTFSNLIIFELKSRSLIK